ncbi:hypothetical protein J1TS3_25610 [Siminovitchia fordii]|uniref:Uncharacterized protein n=1 Tax=Siminovitchia fordii TaxID=254759 RepID=A0ABQ4K6R4_9BACI|nr:hypothetical protein J1TS3_25610 [Siminovitchia fordii]
MMYRKNLEGHNQNTLILDNKGVIELKNNYVEHETFSFSKGNCTYNIRQPKNKPTEEEEIEFLKGLAKILSSI